MTDRTIHDLARQRVEDGDEQFGAEQRRRKPNDRPADQKPMSIRELARMRVEDTKEETL